MTRSVPDRIVVMGVAGSGKTTVGQELAARLGAEFIDADSLHSAANVAKMSDGTPLDDADRWPWLAAVRRELRRSDGVVIACSALTRRYRDLLRGAGDVRFVYLAIDAESARARARLREGHFMGGGMIDSQFATLEAPMRDETDVVAVDGTQAMTSVVGDAVRALGSTPPGADVRP